MTRARTREPGNDIQFIVEHTCSRLGDRFEWFSTEGRTPAASEMARELFGHAEIGVLPRLVHRRFGYHVVEVLEREAGIDRSFGEVRGAVALSLKQQAWVTGLRQLLQVLAGEAAIEGAALDEAATPLVQ